MLTYVLPTLLQQGFHIFSEAFPKAFEHRELISELTTQISISQAKFAQSTKIKDNNLSVEPRILSLL